MLDLSPVGWVVIALCAVMVGITKIGIPGLGILVVPLMASVLPARSSVGVLLGILILADLFAAGYHRRNAKWIHVLRLLPAAFAGIAAGYFGLKVVNDQQLKPIIGGIVLVMLGINYWHTRTKGKDAQVPTQWWFAVVLGFMAGVTTMMANAAGPVMAVYLLSMRLPKEQYVGTGAWFFFIINLIKVPFSASLGLITLETLKVNAMLIPAVALGAIVGITVLKVLPQRVFRVVVQVIAAISAVRLLL